MKNVPKLMQEKGLGHDFLVFCLSAGISQINQEEEQEIKDDYLRQFNLTSEEVENLSLIAADMSWEAENKVSPSLVTLIREREMENERWVDMFYYYGQKDAQDALYQATAHYLETEEGKKQAESTSYDFNWGDFVLYVPNEILEQHSLQTIREGEAVFYEGEIQTIFVDQDEVLCD